MIGDWILMKQPASENVPESQLETMLAQLATERLDPALAEIDTLSILERCVLQNKMDGEVAGAVAGELPRIAEAVGRVASCLRAGGRLIYVGAGTSGRLGVLDAAECPPTFGTPPEMVQAIIAGGEIALTQAVEGVEDDRSAGERAIDEREVGSKDCVVGITASGRTPFVLAALERARERGAGAILGVTNNRPSEIERVAEITLAAVVGPEMVAGSTRMKSGTAQKLILNMLTTQAMIELGKTYGNAMVDVTATNLKLRIRARRMVREITGASEDEAQAALDESGGGAKLAILMLLTGQRAEAARAMLAASNGKLREAIGAAGKRAEDL